jgi:sugar/nucleoside kinase (ribokinase family)
LSEIFVILGHGADFIAMMERGDIDILFANEGEIQTLMGTEDFEAAVALAAALVPTLVVTRGADGAVAIKDGTRSAVAAEPIDKVVDTTGAGDLFAAGFLAGQAQGRSVADSLTMGAICAAEIISHFGPRPEADLKALVAARFS